MQYREDREWEGQGSSDILDVLIQDVCDKTFKGEKEISLRRSSEGRRVLIDSLKPISFRFVSICFLSVGLG